jgi:hypothetical protein
MNYEPIIKEDENFEKIRLQIAISGYAILQSRLNMESCKKIIEFIDEYPNNLSEINYDGSEKRIWKSENNAPLVKEFSYFSDEVMNKILNSTKKVKTVFSYINYQISP